MLERWIGETITYATSEGGRAVDGTTKRKADVYVKKQTQSKIFWAIVSFLAMLFWGGISAEMKAIQACPFGDFQGEKTPKKA